MKDLLYFDMDNVLCNYDKRIAEQLISEPKVAFPQSRYGFYMGLEPMFEAIESYKELKQYYVTKILSRPSVFNALSYTEKRVWVEKHLGFDECYNLILSCDKTIARGNYLIDDNIQTGHFVEDISWKLIHFGSIEFPDWNTVKNHLIRIAKNK